MKKRNTQFWGLVLLGCLFGAQAFAQVNVNMPFNTGVQQTFAITPPNTCSYNFYDSGGPGGLYLTPSNFTTSVVTFAPSVGTNKINVAFASYNTEASFDALYVRDGATTADALIPSANGVPLGSVGVPAGGFWGTTPPNNPATSGSATAVRATAANASGALTFQFYSDAFVNAAGWEASVTEVLPATCAMTAPANITAGTGAGDTDCAADVVTAVPSFNPAGRVAI